MKILVLSSLAYSLTNFRGDLLRAMKANGHKVVAVAPDRDPDVEAELAKSGIELRTIAMQRAGTRPLADLRLLLGYVALMLREKPDLVLAYTQKPIIYGGLAARILAVPRFYAMMTGLGHVFSPSSGVRPWLRKLVGTLYREAVRRANAIFVFNADDREDMLRLKIVGKGQNVVRVPGSGIDLDRFASQPFPRNRIGFLLVARLLRDKGIVEFLDAAQRLSVDFPDCDFSVLGHFDGDNPSGLTRAECETFARQYPVRFIPGTSDVRPYLAGCSVFVLPSYYREGLPRTILEAMATGRPVITTDMPGCRDPIEQGGNGMLVPPRDSGALVTAMRYFLDDPCRVSTMGARSRKLAETIYDVRKVNALLLHEMDLHHPGHYQAGSDDGEDATHEPPLVRNSSTPNRRVAR